MGFYFVLDGHHPVSVARATTAQSGSMPLYVTEYGATESWSDRRDKGDLVEPSKGAEPRMREMMDSQLAKQRREEMLREVRRNRLVKALRDIRGRRDGRRVALVWEIKRQAGRFLKLLRTLRNVGG